MTVAVIEGGLVERTKTWQADKGGPPMSRYDDGISYSDREQRIAALAEKYAAQEKMLAAAAKRQREQEKAAVAAQEVEGEMARLTPPQQRAYLLMRRATEERRKWQRSEIVLREGRKYRVFASLNEAAEFIDIPASTVSGALRRGIRCGGFPLWRRGYPTIRPVIVEHVGWLPGGTWAANLLGLCRSSITQSIKFGWAVNGLRIRYITQDAFKVKSEKKRSGLWVRDDGKVYPSAEDAAVDLALCFTAIVNAANRGHRAGGFYWRFEPLYDFSYLEEQNVESYKRPPQAGPMKEAA